MNLSEKRIDEYFKDSIKMNDIESAGMKTYFQKKLSSRGGECLLGLSLEFLSIEEFLSEEIELLK